MNRERVSRLQSDFKSYFMSLDRSLNYDELRSNYISLKDIFEFNTMCIVYSCLDSSDLPKWYDSWSSMWLQLAKVYMSRLRVLPSPKEKKSQKRIEIVHSGLDSVDFPKWYNYWFSVGLQLARAHISRVRESQKTKKKRRSTKNIKNTKDEKPK